MADKGRVIRERNKMISHRSVSQFEVNILEIEKENELKLHSPMLHLHMEQTDEIKFQGAFGGKIHKTFFRISVVPYGLRLLK